MAVVILLHFVSQLLIICTSRTNFHYSASMVRESETESGKSQGTLKASMSGNPARTVLFQVKEFVCVFVFTHVIRCFFCSPLPPHGGADEERQVTEGGDGTVTYVMSLV